MTKKETGRRTRTSLQYVTREEIIAMLEQVIRTLEFGVMNRQVDPREKDQECTGSVLEETKELLVRVKAGDEEAFRQISENFDRRKKKPEGALRNFPNVLRFLEYRWPFRKSRLANAKTRRFQALLTSLM